MKTSPKITSYIILSIIAIFVIACTIGVSHKLIINDYGDDTSDSIAKHKSRIYNVNFIDFSDTTDFNKKLK